MKNLRLFVRASVGAILILAAMIVTAAPTWARSAPESFADLTEHLSPAVVNVSTTQTITGADDMGDLPPDLQFPPGSPFEQFFKDFMERQQKDGGPKKHKAASLGSGFVIDPQGYIVTNNHVIDGADEITVTLEDDTTLKATLVGRDKKTDLALLKVSSKKPLPAVAWGDSDKARVGDWVIAIGDPYGLGGTVTAGIISARARNINSGPYDDFLQTDASINRGNSGGPMFNMDGEVIGVNTAIFSPSGGSIGIGFAIPSTLAKNIIDQLREHGHIRRGWLGVRIQTVTKEIADGLNLSSQKGALVSSVADDSPAAKAGVEVGDVITRFDGKEVPEMRRLPIMVAGTDVDKTVPLTIIRKGKEMNVNIKVGELPNTDDEDKSDDKSTPQKKEDLSSDKVSELGIKVASLTDTLRQRYDISKSVTGLVVVGFDGDESLAADQGIMVGDVITEAAQEDVKSAKMLSELAQKAKKDGKPLLLLINRKDDLRFIALPFDKK